METLKFSYFRLLILLCLIPHSTNCHQLAANSTDDDQRWTQWLQYIRKTSDKNDGATLSDSDSLFVNTYLQPNNSCRKIIVAKDRSLGNYSTIQEVVDSVPINNTVCTLISVQAGVYREKVVVPKYKPYITFQGEKARTAVVWNDTARTIGPKRRPLMTFHSATVAINSKYFTAKGMIFKNDAPPPVPGRAGGQAVALRVTADLAAFYDCRFHGYQDTLYDHKGRHYFKNCYVDGSIDFIFGNGRSLYKDCLLHASSLGNGSVGSVTAQKRNQTSLNTGFSFVNCNLTGHGSVYLGRPWGTDSRVVFAMTWMDKIVIPQGWSNWGIPSMERSVYYGEYKCWGPGASNARRVPWARILTFEEAQPFLGIRFINGVSWLEAV